MGASTPLGGGVCRAPPITEVEIDELRQVGTPA